MSTATPPISPPVTRKYFSASMSARAQARSTDADIGPWSASAAVVSETSSMCTCIPAAFCVSQRRFGSAAVQRKRCSSSRATVPSSMT
ncbi:hypothetical protein D3C83_23690 [compost metagenome]